ncbi:MAG: SAM-dependent methyltransferase [Planctomycetota bacterium]|nr:SAM-dependent methyltransferase [Planctomycetota bacterium]
MDPASFDALLTREGQAALAEAEALAPARETLLAHHKRLSKQYPRELARAALEQAMLRARARAKFSAAARMYFTAEALEQASGERIAAHRARRFAGFASVADLCCGIGGDALSLAAVARVEAADLDPLRLRMAEANARALGLEDRLRFHALDLEQDPPPPAAAFFFDPDRRAGGRRHVSMRGYRPSMDRMAAWRAAMPACGVKLAPGVPHEELDAFEAEQEFLSVDGELKEGVLWFGPLRTAGLRATLLPGGETLAAETPPPPAALSEPRAYLYEPDPSVLRARLVPLLAERIGAAQIDPAIAFLTGERRAATPFARAYAIEEQMPYSIKRLREALRSRKVGRVEWKQRGLGLDAEEAQRALKLDGDEVRTVFLTRVNGRPWALIGRPAEG